MDAKDAGSPRTHHPGPDEALVGASDERLMTGVASGSHDAFAVLVERYWVRLVSFSAGMLDSREAAEDVVQETFIRVWRRREAWTPDGAVTAYLYTVTRRLSLNALRSGAADRRRRRRQAASPLPPLGPRPDEVLRERRLAEAVDAAVQALPERRREVFVLARFHGLSYEQIAQAMGISTRTVANQMSAALRDLRALLTPLDEL